VKDIAAQFEFALYKLAFRMVKQVVREDYDGHLDAKAGKYVDDYIRSPGIRNDLTQAISNFCRDDSEFVAQVRKIVSEVIDEELRQVVAARLQEVKVGDKNFTDWLIHVAIKESLTSEAVRQTIESAVRAHIEAVMRRVLTTGLTGLSVK
jgi:hypothetical protein